MNSLWSNISRYLNSSESYIIHKVCNNNNTTTMVTGIRFIHAITTRKIVQRQRNEHLTNLNLALNCREGKKKTNRYTCKFKETLLRTRFNNDQDVGSFACIYICLCIFYSWSGFFWLQILVVYRCYDLYFFFTLFKYLQFSI